ncbi:hypothetical protein GBA52_005919 [Prunus armeniaca]|nr:hypothetical protein GBA52_005919 [Prunus armeniaca]
MVDGGIFLEPMHNPCPKLQVTSRIQLSPVAESKWGNSWNAHVFPLPCYDRDTARERANTTTQAHPTLEISFLGPSFTNIKELVPFPSASLLPRDSEFRKLQICMAASIYALFSCKGIS